MNLQALASLGTRSFDKSNCARKVRLFLLFYFNLFAINSQGGTNFSSNLSTLLFGLLPR